MSYLRTYWRIIGKLFFFILFLSLLQITLSYTFVYQTSIHQVRQRLEELTLRIEKDLKYENGKWDTSRYNADPFTPYPNGSSGFTNPLYIVTNDGFIIERSQPIKGILDTSDFKHLVKFSEPQTIDTITNESWRVLSRPIVGHKNNVLGVAVVSFYNPQRYQLEEIDRKLEESLISIFSSLDVKNNEINTHGIDIRNIHYEYSFEVVDKYNNVLINNGRVPTFIDPSYFSKAIGLSSGRSVFDIKTQQQYYVVTKVITSNSSPIGIILAGELIDPIEKTLKSYVLFSLGISLIFIIPLVLSTIAILLKNRIRVEGDYKTESENVITKIVFNKKDCVLYINEKIYHIPYASHQYYICNALFSQPDKKWEYDQLLDKMGDNNEQINTRKVYDAVLAINKRVNYKLIEYRNKVFFINPNIRNFIVKL